MADTNDPVLRELNSINASITKLYSYHDETMSIIQQILIQTTKTNGRVTNLERAHDTCPIEKVMKETEEVRFFAKRPNLFKLVLLGSVIVCVISVIVSATSAMKTVSEIKKSTEQTEQYINDVLDNYVKRK